MKNKINVVIGLAIVAAIGGILYRAFGQGIEISQAIDDIEKGRKPAEARVALEAMNDRGTVIDALHEALAEDGTVRGKLELLQALGELNETRAVRRALDSPSLATRRAAAYRWHGTPGMEERVKPITLEWLEDGKADSRHLAAMVCDRLKLAEAVPTLMAILEDASAPMELHRHAIHALANFNPEGLAPKVLALAKNAAADPFVRGTAFDVIGRLEGVPQDEVQALMIETIKDAKAANILRNKATGVLMRPQFANEEVWQALQDVLFDPEMSDSAGSATDRDLRWVIQRGCLKALGRTFPLDRMEQLVLDRRVYRHPYFAIRVDVAAAMATLRMKKRIVLDILTEYLVDDDSNDRTNLVRQEAWMTLWTLTGISYGVPEAEKFQTVPPPIREEEAKRDHLFSTHQLRPGVSFQQVQAVQAVVADLAQMKTIRQTYQGLFVKVEQKWREEEKDGAGDEKPPVVGPQKPPNEPEKDEPGEERKGD